MEEEKAAAYYDELSRKGEGAARFKQGLGFSSSHDQNDAVPQRGSAFVSSSSSLLSSFVRASSPTTASKLVKESQLQCIQNKLKKKPEREARVSERGRVKDRHSRRRSRSRSNERYRERDREGTRRRSRSGSPRKECRSRSSSSPRRDRRSERRRSRSSSLSPREGRRSERDLVRVRESKSKKDRNGAIDYSRLIEGYDKLSPAERVKAKMKLQLAETGDFL